MIMNWLLKWMSLLLIAIFIIIYLLLSIIIIYYSNDAPQHATNLIVSTLKIVLKEILKKVFFPPFRSYSPPFFSNDQLQRLPQFFSAHPSPTLFTSNSDTPRPTNYSAMSPSSPFPLVKRYQASGSGAFCRATQLSFVRAAHLHTG